MKTQDVIINRERLLKTIYDLDSAKCLQDDKNCQLLLNFLLEGPMTFEDIKNSFIEVQAEKSDKTIYGYLNKLKKTDLVMETGKRIITFSESQIKTLTLYSRTAKVFYIAIDIKKEKRETYFELIGKLLCQILDYTDFDRDCFKKLYDDFIQSKRNDVQRINEIENSDIVELIASNDVRGTKFVIDTYMFFAFIAENQNITQEFNKCFKKKS